MPYFSIIIPTYNRAHLIAATLRSVMAQTLTDWELLLIDDGSTDNTKQEVGKFTDNRIQYVWQQNAERSAARNKGITLAKGEVICFLDSDDVWLPTHLEILYKAIEQREFTSGVYFTAMRWCFEDGKKQDVVFDPPENQNVVEYVIQNQIAPSTQCVHREIVAKHKFNISLKINEDVELNTRMVNEYPLFQIPIVTVEMLVHNENTKSLHKNYIAPQIEVMKIIFSNPGLKNKISWAFKKQRMAHLDHSLINFYLETKQFSKINKAIIRFLFLYPTHVLNKSKLVLLLYNLPCGSLLKKTVNWAKGKK